MSGGFLAEIVAHKRREVEARRALRPMREVDRRAVAAPPARAFAQALDSTQPAVIAEIKQASPSAGVIRSDFNVQAIANSYQAGGATCLSVLTDERFFRGADWHLSLAREVSGLPALRKDFLLDVYQVFESRALGADCVLLIAAILEPERLASLAKVAGDLGMDVLFEVHDQAELDTVLALRPKLVGVNNRDLRTFDTRLENTIALRSRIPDDVTVVAESGIRTRDDVTRLQAANVRAFLVGTAFMRRPSPGEALRDLFG